MKDKDEEKKEKKIKEPDLLGDFLGVERGVDDMLGRQKEEIKPNNLSTQELVSSWKTQSRAPNDQQPILIKHFL